MCLQFKNMKNHARLFFVTISLMVIHTLSRKLFQVGNTEYTLRITNFTDCAEFLDNPSLLDMKLTPNGNIQYINGKMKLVNDYCIKLVNVKINRCLNFNYACEYFQTWNITDVCMFSRMRNSMWGPFHNAIEPSGWLRNCPCFKKGVLTLRNASVDLKQIINFYSEAPKYHWQILIQVYDKKNVKQQCLYLTFYLTSYNSKVPLSTSTPLN